MMPREILYEIFQYLDGFEREQLRVVAKWINIPIKRFPSEKQAIKHREVHWITFGLNSLHYACKYGHIDIMKVILRKVDKIRYALQIACDKGNLIMLKYLLGIYPGVFDTESFLFTSYDQIDDEVFSDISRENKILRCSAYLDDIDMFKLHYRKYKQILIDIASDMDSKRVIEYIIEQAGKIAIERVRCIGSIYCPENKQHLVMRWMSAINKKKGEDILYLNEFIGNGLRRSGFYALYGKKIYKDIGYIFIDIEKENDWENFMEGFISHYNHKGIMIALNKLCVEAETINDIIYYIGDEYDMAYWIYSKYKDVLDSKSIYKLIEMGFNIKTTNEHYISAVITGGCLDSLEYILANTDIAITSEHIKYAIEEGCSRTIKMIHKYRKTIISIPRSRLTKLLD